MDPRDADVTAERWLATTLPRRWRPTQGVTERAATLVQHIENGVVLVAACWLHDIGYSPHLVGTQFHPLDGAVALRSWGADEVICGLVAHHSAASYEAEVLDLIDELRAFMDPRGLVRDLLWHLDMTTSPDGDRVSFEDRMKEVQYRYSANRYVIRALNASMVDRRNAVDRAEAWLSSIGLAGQV